MKHASCRCSCSHVHHDDAGQCLYEYWDDWTWYEGNCVCDEPRCQYTGEAMRLTARGWACRWEGVGLNDESRPHSVE